MEGFRTFGGGPNDDFIDFTNPNPKRRKNSNKILNQTSKNITNNQLSSNRGEEILDRVKRKAETPLRKAVVRGQEQQERQQIFSDAAAGMRAEQIANRAAKRKELAFRAGKFSKQFGEGKDLLNENIGRAQAIAEKQAVDFSEPQRMMGEMFGQGERVWGQNQEPVRINNDLNSSRSDPFDETGGIFGFGNGGEKSGLF